MHTILATLGGLIAAALVALQLFTVPMTGAVLDDLGIDFESFDSMLKELWSPKKVQELIFRKNKLLAMVPKWTKWEGKALHIGLQYGDPTGISNTFADGKSSKTPSKYGEFVLGTKQLFGFVNIDHELIVASKSDAGSLLRAKQKEIDGMFRQMGRRLAIQMYRNGSGTVGQLDQPAGAVNIDVITLARRSDVRNFEVGQVLKFHADDTGTGVTRGGELQITKIDRQAGTLTVDDDLNAGVATIQDGDYISFKGDYGKAFMGLAGWLPTTAPTDGESFFGLDRSVDTRLGGNRFDYTGMGYEDAFVNMLMETGAEGASIGHIFVNPADYGAFERALGSKVTNMYTDVGSEAGVGFKGIKIYSEDGEAVVLSDINCPQGLAYGVTLDTLRFNSRGEIPAMWDEDGNMHLRAADANSLDVQAYGYGEFSCDAPGWNCVAQIG